MDDEDKVMGRMTGEQNEPDETENMVVRLVYMILIWFMIQFAYTALGIVTLLQFVVMVLNKREPNERLADFGTDLGIWVAKAARYQTAASDVKPWPWTELD